ncbi:hypothetical protein EB151_14520 [archaeon]|nr:hypothetical protein [archaeon]
MLFNNIKAGIGSDNFIQFVNFNFESDNKGWFFHFQLGWYYLYVPLKFNSNKDGIWLWNEKLGIDYSPDPGEASGKKDVIGLSSGWQWHSRYWCIQNYIFAYDGLNIANFTSANINYWIKQALSLNKVDDGSYSDKMCNSNDVSTGDGVLFGVQRDTYGSNFMLLRPYIRYNLDTGESTSTDGFYYFYKTSSSPYYAYFKT